MKEVREALKGGDVATIRTANEKLNEAWQSVSAELYKAASEKARAGKDQGQPGTGPGEQASAGGPTGGPGGKQDEGPIIDAEVVDEKKS